MQHLKGGLQGHPAAQEAPEAGISGLLLQVEAGVTGPCHFRLVQPVGKLAFGPLLPQALRLLRSAALLLAFGGRSVLRLDGPAQRLRV